MTDYPPDRRLSDIPLGDTSRILAIMYTLGFFGVVFSVTWYKIPLENKELVAQVMGILSVIQTGIIGYFFGSSRSAEVSLKAGVASRQKADSTIQDIAKATPTNGAIPEAPKDKIVVPEQVLKVTKPLKRGKIR